MVQMLTKCGRELDMRSFTMNATDDATSLFIKGAKSSFRLSTLSCVPNNDYGTRRGQNIQDWPIAIGYTPRSYILLVQACLCD